MQNNRFTSRYALVADVISLVHSMFAIVVGLSVFLYDLPSFKFWLWDHWKDTTTNKQCTLFMLAAFYFVCDTFLLCQRKFLTRHEVGLICHHVCCLCGLLFPVWSGRDGALVLAGYILGEIPNPPRLLSILADHPEFRTSWIVKWQLSLVTLHYALFVSTRVLCVDFLVKVAWQHSFSWITLAAAFSLILFSVAALFEYCMETDGNHANTKQGIVGLNVRYGARRV